MIIDEVWRIAIGDEHSSCALAWEEQNFKVNHFEAVTPDTMDDYLIFDVKRRNKREHNPIVEFTPTEKAIWYSHYSLWEKCLVSDKPFVIIESDVIPIGDFPLEWEVEYMKYFCRSSSPDRYSTTIKYTPAAGYIITPKGASRLIEFTHHRPIITNVDGAMRECRDDNPAHTKGGWAKQYAMQILRENKTIEHL